jgi:adenosylcobinamide-GDP ribazoletransferase
MAEHNRNVLLRELRVLLTAIVFFSRIPIPLRSGYDQTLLAQAGRYLPLVGLIVGVVAGGTFWLSALIIPVPPAIILSMAIAVIATGAFHEDGLADTADGFGGGWTVERKLEIMKDSRVGTYGAIALVLSMLLRFHLLTAVFERLLLDAQLGGSTLSPISRTALVIVTVHLGARLVPVFVMAWLDYVRLDETSKVKPVAKSISAGSVVTACCFSVIATWTLGFLQELIGLALTLPTAALASLFFRKQIGGYTGDTLGASEQFGELVLLSVAAARF